MTHLLFWKLSCIALSFSAGADMATSRGQVELNPIMAQHGQFTGRSIAVGSLITGGALVAEWLVLRR
ncbi:MAG TPA: hypothetical protein VFW83_06080, partial [Bryobacteraceae bacterium]|nr:hypothetical protein [Bryobacteraceae bacterium]